MPIRCSAPLAATLALAAVFGTVGAQAADMPGHHAAYLHALSDLRHARWNIEHRAGDAAMKDQEHRAIAEVDRAIADATRAAREDGKNVAQDEHEDAALDHAGALHHAQDLLVKAKQDVSEAEDDPRARGERASLVAHIDRALEATRQAIRDAQQHR